MPPKVPVSSSPFFLAPVDRCFPAEANLLGEAVVLFAINFVGEAVFLLSNSRTGFVDET